ncbi:DUF1295 domain-containing protein [Paeniglutamicibacter sp. NPDC091659]|uniref:DUF1295 domain-containing protein n=1 Tax=Paeniglutamicibacter sp. NPDC091659 TaxID=3364389 RepID=UPI003806F1A6
MKDSNRRALIALPVVVLVGALLALAGSDGGAVWGTIPVFTLAVVAAFLIQWIAFIPSFLSQTEKYYDLTGTVTYTAITLLVLFATPGIHARSLLLAVMVLAWTLRLGIFLFRRVSRAGKDDRFDEIKPSFVRFLSVWTIQGLWVTFTAAAAWVAMTSANRVTLDGFALIGFIVWGIGFGLEIVADQQKACFNCDPANKGKFISTGLWSKSRHPNYFGEILLWIGVAIVALPVLQGWQWVAVISPVFVALLLIKISGIPLLERKAESKWGGQHDYESYKENTPVLIPKFW